MPRFSPLIAVGYLFAMTGFMFGVWASRIPAIQGAYDLNEAQLGAVLLCFGSGSIVAFPLAGRLMDRLGSARVSKATAVACVMLLPLLPWAPNVWVLGCVLAICGAAFGSLDVAMNGWGAAVEATRSKPVMSSFHGLFSLGAGAGALSGFVAINAGMSVAEHFAWVSAIMAVGVLLVTRVAFAHVAPDSDGPAFALPSGPLWVVGGVMLCAAMGEGAVADWSAIYLRDVMEADEGRAAMGFALFSLMMFATRMCADGWVARWGAVRIARVCSAIATLGALLVVMPAFLPIGFAGALVGFALIGIGLAPIFPLGCIRAANDDRLTPGQGLAGVATLGYGGLLMGPPVIGFVAHEWGLMAGFMVVLIGCALIGFGASSLRPVKAQALLNPSAPPSTTSSDPTLASNPARTRG